LKNAFVLPRDKFILGKTTNPMFSLPQRYPRAAFLTAVLLLLGWLISIKGGTSFRDHFGQPLGPDFLPFYSAATLLHEDRGGELYDFQSQIEIQSRILHSPQEYLHPYLNLPLFAWVLKPLALLEYQIAFALWTLLGVIVLFLSAWRLGASVSWSVWGWFPVFAATAYGQNSFLSLGIVSFCAWLWVDRRKAFLAGMMAGILLYKPQLILGLGLGFLILREWRVLAGMMTTALIGGGFSMVVLKNETIDYFRFSSERLPLLMSAPGAPFTQFFDTRGFLKLLVPTMGGVPLMIGWGSVLLLVLVLFWRWSWSCQREEMGRYRLMAGVLLLIPWGAPYLLLYDWILLLVPFWLLSRGGRDEKRELSESVGSIWIVSLLSYPISAWMLAQWGFAFQGAPLVLGWVTWRFFRRG
jgi:hypothetical protein